MYFWVRTHTDYAARLPEKHNPDSMSFFFVRAFEAKESSIMYKISLH